MKNIIVYNTLVYNNFFCITFRNSVTKKQSACYVLDDNESNTSMLPKIINSCTLIGYGNNSFDDLILNYIFHNKEIYIREIVELSRAIMKQKETTNELWRNINLSFYTNGYVNSFDLTETSNIESIDKFNDNIILKGDLDNILLTNTSYVSKIDNALDRLKSALNDGFISSSKINITKETIRRNYIKNIIGL